MRPGIAPAPDLRSRRALGPTIAAVLGAVALIALVVGPFTALFESPSFVDEITFANPTEYHLLIEVTGAERDGWMSVGTAQRSSTTVVEETIDQGNVWIFRFSGQGQQAGELRLTRAQLEGERWTVRIPDSIGAALRAMGAPPPP